MKNSQCLALKYFHDVAGCETAIKQMGEKYDYLFVRFEMRLLKSGLRTKDLETETNFHHDNTRGQVNNTHHGSHWVSQQLLISSYLAGNSQRAAAVGWLEMPRYQVSEEKSQTCLRWQKVSCNSPGGYDLRHAEGNLSTQNTSLWRTTRKWRYSLTEESLSGMLGHNSSSSMALLFIWSELDINNMKVLKHVALCQ